jgi:hypothetical protein
MKNALNNNGASIELFGGTINIRPNTKKIANVTSKLLSSLKIRNNIKFPHVYYQSNSLVEENRITIVVDSPPILIDAYRNKQKRTLTLSPPILLDEDYSSPLPIAEVQPNSAPVPSSPILPKEVPNEEYKQYPEELAPEKIQVLGPNEILYAGEIYTTLQEAMQVQMKDFPGYASNWGAAKNRGAVIQPEPVFAVNLFWENPKLARQVYEVLGFKTIPSNVESLSDFEGTIIEYVNHIDIVDGKNVGARNINKGEKIQVVLDEMRKKFKDKAWTKAVHSEPLPENEFKSFEELMLFVYLHEKAHEYVFRDEGESLIAYETRVNNEALRRLRFEFTLSQEQKEEAIDKYDEYLKTTNNPTIEGFKQWFVSSSSIPPIQGNQYQLFQKNTIFNQVLELNEKLKNVNKTISGLGSEKNLNELLKKADISADLRAQFIQLVRDNPNLKTLKVSEVLNFYIRQFEKDSNEQFYEAIMSPVNTELEKLLIKYFDRFSITNVELENIKDRFGVDASGVFDVLNKTVFYSKNRNLLTLPEEYGHVFVELLGAVPSKKAQNPLFQYLFDEIESWDGYARVFNAYKDLYTTSRGTPDIFRIKKEAIGQVIGLALVRNYEGNAKDKTFWQKIKELIDYIFDLLDGVDYVSLNTAADSIARDILSGNYAKLDRLQKDTSNYNLLSYSETIRQQNKKDNGLALSFMKWFSDMGMIITGSLSYRYQGETYRPNIDALHDIDNVVPADVHNFPLTEEEFLDKITAFLAPNSRPGFVRIDADKLALEIPILKKLKDQFPDTEFLYAYNSNKADNFFITINAIWSKDESLKERFKSYTGSFNDRLAKFTEEEINRMYLFDFFLTSKKSEEFDIIKDSEFGLALNHFSESFIEKQGSMGRPKDAYDYQKWKSFPETSPAPIDLKSRFFYYQVENTYVPVPVPSDLELTSEFEIARAMDNIPTLVSGDLSEIEFTEKYCGL